jgi:hypothetical protein
MEITLSIPAELARQVPSQGKQPARVALEALALEGYPEQNSFPNLGFDRCWASKPICKFKPFRGNMVFTCITMFPI